MRSRVPRYHQIAQALRDKIGAGDIAPGARLDNQRRLAMDFGVTLMTLRQALEVLERDGLITRRHGLGTFVASPSVDYDILHFRAFAGDLTAVGEDVATRFLRTQAARADRHAARELGLKPGARVFVLERLRLVDGHPTSFQVSHLPAALGEEVARADLAVTPGAVSRQIQALEASLGVRLFARGNRAVELTPRGQVYARQVQEAFDRLGLATEQLRGRDPQGPLAICAYPTFAMRWLMPRWRRFHDMQPRSTCSSPPRWRRSR